MTIDRIVRYLKDAAEDAEQCLIELDAKVQDLEGENADLRSRLDDAETEAEHLADALVDAESALREANRVVEARAPGLKPEER